MLASSSDERSRDQKQNSNVKKLISILGPTRCELIGLLELAFKQRLHKIALLIMIHSIPGLLGKSAEAEGF
jgi:hypothetical protein